MDFGCLLGVCSAMAQAAVDGAPVADASAPPAGSDPTGTTVQIGLFIFVGAQLLAPVLLWLYHRAVLRAMNSDAAPEPASRHPVSDVATLITVVRRRQQRTMALLALSALVFACPAGWFFAYWGYPGTLDRISLVTSIALFGVLAAPIVMLGGSALHFRRRFWGLLAPFALMTTAVQIMLVDAYQVLWKLSADVSALKAAGKADEARAREQELQDVLSGWIDYLPPFIETLFVVGCACLAGWHLLGPRRRAAIGRFVLRRRLTTGGLGFLTLGLLGLATEQHVQGERILEDIISFGLLGLFCIALLYLSLGSRSQRVVVPLLALVGFALVTVAALSNELGAESLRGLFGAIDTRIVTWTTLADGSLSPVASHAVKVTGLVMACLGGWFILSWIGLAYEQKVFSDAQFEVYAWLLSIAGMVAFVDAALSDYDLFHSSTFGVGGSAVVALIVYSILVRIGRPPRSRHHLLLLRVFKTDKRGERLLDEIARRWRFLGPIMMIGGPDLARATVDPSEISHFLRLQLHGDFVNDEAGLDRRIHGIDEDPDPDGRYRINEFYCRRNIWQLAVERLVRRSHAILLDLRGYDKSRAGLTFEIQLLGLMGMHGRTVFLLDDSTDLDLVVSVVGEAAWSAIPESQRIRTEEDVDGDALFAALGARALATSGAATGSAGAVESGQAVAAA